MPPREPDRRHRAYFWLMGTCVVLIILAWQVVRHFSIAAAVAMSVVAALIPPVAAIVGNWGQLREPDEPSLEERFRDDRFRDDRHRDDRFRDDRYRDDD